jgi:hypothetical protein
MGIGLFNRYVICSLFKQTAWPILKFFEKKDFLLKIYLAITPPPLEDKIFRDFFSMKLTCNVPKY